MLARALLMLFLVMPLPGLAQMRWMEGRHFITLPNPQTAETRAGRIEVAEVFSYACIHCYRMMGEIAKLQAALPADAYLTFVHASFRPDEAWPMFQRAWYTAQALGIGAANHEKMFAAVWETQELPLMDANTGKLRRPLPTLAEAAKFYAGVSSVKAADFLQRANSAAITAQMKRTDALVQAWRVPGTPAVIVNGRYLIDNQSMSSSSEMRSLVLYLVGLERKRLGTPAARP